MVKLDIQSCARRLYMKTSTVSDLQNLQPCQTGWGMNSMASGRSSPNHTHLKVKACTLLLICQDACWEAATCSLKLCLPCIKFGISSYCAPSPLYSLPPWVQTCSHLQKVPKKWHCCIVPVGGNLGPPPGENDPASNGGMNDILDTTHSKQ